jgi:hypothetical protein
VLERLIREDPDVEADDSSKSYVRFAPGEWNQSIALRSGSGWTRSGRLLLFEFHYRGNDLRLKLTIGLGPQPTRQLLLDTAVAHRPPFTVTNRNLHQKWDMIYDRQMVKDALSLEMSIDDVEAQLRQRWADFVAGDLQAITSALKAQRDLWQ